MAANSKIEWTQRTWNPTVGCDRVSPGCDGCYAIRMGARQQRLPAYEGTVGYVDGRLDWTGRVNLVKDRLTQPLRWRKPAMVFVDSMSDLFHADVPDGFIAQVWEVMAQCPQHTFQILTKRHGRMRSWLKRWHDTTGDESVANNNGMPPMPRGPEAVREVYSSPRALLFADMLYSMGTPPEGAAYPLYDWMEGPRWFPGVLPNVWVGVSVEDQKWADIRIPALLDTPAAVRWISAEPLLGEVNLAPDDHSGHERDYQGTYYECLDCSTDESPVEWTTQEMPPLDWCVVGGESGPGTRPMDLEWARLLVRQCKAAGTAVFVKQLGSRWGTHHHDIVGFPEDLRVREYPVVSRAG
jgi:protein gp37